MRKVKNLFNSRLKLVALCIEGATAVFGTASIISNAHPYVSLSILAIGAIANKVVQYLDTEQY